MFGDFRTAALLGAGLAFTSCDALEPTFCTTDFRWGLEVSVFDAETGASLADSATLHLRDGTWTETVDDPVWPGEPGVIHAAGERGGMYDVTVERPRYQTWTRSGVRVEEDECHMIPVALDAALILER